MALRDPRNRLTVRQSSEKLHALAQVTLDTGLPTAEFILSGADNRQHRIEIVGPMLQEFVEPFFRFQPAGKNHPQRSTLVALCESEGRQGRHGMRYKTALESRWFDHPLNEPTWADR